MRSGMTVRPTLEQCLGIFSGKTRTSLIASILKDQPQPLRTDLEFALNGSAFVEVEIEG
jgi:hypothetical protein